MLLYARTMTGRSTLHLPPCQTMHLIFTVTQGETNDKENIVLAAFSFWNSLIMRQCNNFPTFQNNVIRINITRFEIYGIASMPSHFRNAKYAFLNAHSETKFTTVKRWIWRWQGANRNTKSVDTTITCDRLKPRRFLSRSDLSPAVFPYKHCI